MMSRVVRPLFGVLILCVACPGGTFAQDATPEASPVSTDTTAALFVSAFSKPMVVAGSDGMDHIEYDLMFSNVFTGPVTLTRIEAMGPDGAVLLDLQGDALTANTKPLLPTETTNIVPFSGSVATVMDVAVPRGTAPASLTHRISYQLEPGAVLTALIGSTTIDGPEVTIEPRPALVVSSPFAGGRWLNVDGCCFAGTHRSVITSGNGLQLHKMESFAIDWVGLDATDVFTGDGTQNTDYIGYGTDILSATAGTVISVRDGHPEPAPNQPPILAGPADFSGNSVVVQVAEDVYALYAHLQSGSVAVAVGDTVTPGLLLGKLGNSGNTTAPHLHFQLSDGPDAVTSNSLPFVIDSYQLVGEAEIAFENGNPVVPTITGEPSGQTNTLPLDNTVIEFPS
jgi:murein DD-endopeptidase MepM/ murein hydrolase activator NlpD